jgi:Transcription factor TFIID (or TATA-binding protein, TBP)
MNTSPTRVTSKEIVARAIAKAKKENAIARIKNIVRRAKAKNRPIAYMDPNGAYSLTKPVITGRTVIVKYPYANVVIPLQLPRGFLSMDGRTAVRALPTFRVTKERVIGTSPTQVKHWYIKTTHGFALIHKDSGTVQISGKSIGVIAHQLERVCPGISNMNMRITKFDADMIIGRHVKLDTLAFLIPDKTEPYEPEVRNAVTLRWPSPAMTLMVYASGIVKIFGASKPAQAVDVMRQVIDRVTPRAIFKTGVSERRDTFTRNERLANLRAKKLAGRHSLAPGYNYIPPAGQYVRPGPNGKPRVYNVRPDMRLSAKKILKAYSNAGVPVPRYVQNLIGSAPVMYGASAGPKSAKNWNSRLNGHYVAPGPGKQPYFYKLPKDLKAGYATAKKRYTNAGIRMPNQVQTLFGVTPNGGGGAGPSRRHTVQNNKVNGKAYKKLTVAQLVNVAHNLGNEWANSKMTKNVLFQRIKNKATVISPKKTNMSPRRPNVSVGGRTYIFSNDPTNQRIIRNGRARVFNTLPKNERTAIMNAYFRGSTNYKSYKPKEWYNVLRAYKGTRTPSTTNSVNNLANELMHVMLMKNRLGGSPAPSSSSSSNRGLGMPKNIP